MLDTKIKEERDIMDIQRYRLHYLFNGCVIILTYQDGGSIEVQERTMQGSQDVL